MKRWDSITKVAKEAVARRVSYGQAVSDEYLYRPTPENTLAKELRDRIRKSTYTVDRDHYIGLLSDLVLGRRDTLDIKVDMARWDRRDYG